MVVSAMDVAAMDLRALWTIFLPAWNGRANEYANRNADEQPETHIPGQHTEDRAQRRAQRDTESCVFGFVRHRLCSGSAELRSGGTGEGARPHMSIPGPLARPSAHRPVSGLCRR